MKYLFKAAAIFGMFLLTLCDDDVTLTTAKSNNQEDIPKPTTLHRRINVGLVGDTPKDSLNLLDLLQPERRSNSEVLWKWDYWCQIQPKTGDCAGAGRDLRYYYNAQLDECLSFNYSGCDGNKNNFDSIVDCDRRCKGSIFMPFKAIERKESCALQSHSGVCLGLMYRYYYDINSESCKKFLYGGCGGNQNRFRTSMECMERCMYSGETEEDSSPPFRSQVLLRNSTIESFWGTASNLTTLSGGVGVRSTKLNVYEY